jgi:transcriptional regulator with XRE-family HTH domain
MQGCVALLQCVPITLKALKPKESDFEPETMGEHVKKRRLELGLTQNRAAERLGVNSWTILNWERGHTEPPTESMPAITWFLGYDPYPEPKNIPERLLAKRREMGWSIKEAARQVGVDAGTWGAWERGETILFRKHRALIARLLGLSAKEVFTEMADQWNRSHQRPTVKINRL